MTMLVANSHFIVLDMLFTILTDSQMQNKNETWQMCEWMITIDKDNSNLLVFRCSVYSNGLIKLSWLCFHVWVLAKGLYYPVWRTLLEYHEGRNLSRNS